MLPFGNIAQEAREAAAAPAAAAAAAPSAPSNSTGSSTGSGNELPPQPSEVDALQDIMRRLNFMDATTQFHGSNETVLILQQQDRTLQVLVDVLRIDVAQVRDLLEQCGYDIAMTVATYYSQLALLQPLPPDNSSSSSNKKRGWAPSGESPAKIRIQDKLLMLRGTPVGWECYSKPNGVVFFRHIESGTECLNANIQLPTITSTPPVPVFLPVDYSNGGEKV